MMHDNDGGLSQAATLNRHSGVADSDDAAQRLLMGCSTAIHQLRATIRRLAAGRIPVLIVGPTGAGKELVARALHALSGAHGDLVSFNVAAVAETMFEATLFGHVKGAFTGALTSAPGYMAEANDGTLFLDEIGNLNVAGQAKLLRALETGTYRPVGATRDRQSRFRVLAATNEDLTRRAQSGSFRADLYHRIGGFIVRVPGLRDRPDDVELLMHHFLSLSGAPRTRLTTDAMRTLTDYDWPGNVRELRHVAERIALLSGETGHATRDIVLVAIGASRTSSQDTGDSLDSARGRLLAALRGAGWNAAAAGQILGVDRATVYRWMRREGITAPPRRTRDAGQRDESAYA